MPMIRRVFGNPIDSNNEAFRHRMAKRELLVAGSAALFGVQAHSLTPETL